MTTRVLKIAALVAFAHTMTAQADTLRTFELNQTNRVLIRFSGSAAGPLNQQFRKNYKNKVSGIVDGQDVACVTAVKADPKSKESICAFIVDRDGVITNAFQANPETNEATVAQLALQSGEAVDGDLKNGTFEHEDIFELTDTSANRSGSVKKRSDKKFRGQLFQLAGEQAEVLYNFIDQGRARSKTAKKIGFAHPTTVSERTKANVKCEATIKPAARNTYLPKKKKLVASKKNSAKSKSLSPAAVKAKQKFSTIEVSPKDLEFRCLFGFDSKGVARLFAKRPATPTPSAVYVRPHTRKISRPINPDDGLTTPPSDPATPAVDDSWKIDDETKTAKPAFQEWPHSRK